MADEEDGRLARKGLALVERAENVSPDALAQKVKDAAKGAAGSAVLGGMALLDDLTGGGDARSRPRPSEAAVERMHEKLDAASVAEYDQRLAQAASRFMRTKAAAAAMTSQEHETVAQRRARLRRSFPAESKELATLVFRCVDLLEDAARSERPSDEELRKQEALLRRIAQLLSPQAGPALESFVAHVSAIARGDER